MWKENESGKVEASSRIVNQGGDVHADDFLIDLTSIQSDGMFTSASVEANFRNIRKKNNANNK